MIAAWSAATSTSSAHILLNEKRENGGGYHDPYAACLEVEGKTNGETSSAQKIAVDLRRGYFRIEQDVGPFHAVDGYDGKPYTAQNGIVTPITLPRLVGDAISESFVYRLGWKTGRGFLVTSHSRGRLGDLRIDFLAVVPAGGSPIQLWFDADNHQLIRVVFSTDKGDLSIDYTDWRQVGEIRYPFRQSTKNADGRRTVLTVDQARTLPCEDTAVLRPPTQSRRRYDTRTDSTVPFQWTAFDHGHQVIAAQVNGSPVSLIFDTGAANYFTERTADRLHLAQGGEISIGGVAGAGDHGGFATVESVAIGPAELRNQAAIVGPLPFVATHPRAGLDVDGLTGYEFLSEFVITVDFPKQTLTILQDPGTTRLDGQLIPFFSDGHDIYIEATVAGANGLFRLDTGDGGGLTVFRRFARAHKLLQSRGYANRISGGIGGELATVEYDSVRFSIGKLRFPSIPVTVTDTSAGSFSSKTLAGNIGSALIRHLRVTFDYAHSHLVAVAAGPYVATSGRDYGWSLNQTSEDSIHVLAVKPGSKAATAGIAPGDDIIRLAGSSVRDRHLGVFDFADPALEHSGFDMAVLRQGVEISLRMPAAATSRSSRGQPAIQNARHPVGNHDEKGNARRGL
jgi:hypothetical protein